MPLSAGSIFIKPGELFFNRVGAAPNFDHGVAQLFGTNEVAEERPRHHKHLLAKDIVYRDAAEGEMRIQGQRVSKVLRIGRAAYRKNRQILLVVFALRDLDDHLLEPVAWLGDNDAKSVTRALNEAVEALGAFPNQALGVTQSLERKRKGIGKLASGSNTDRTAISPGSDSVSPAQGFGNDDRLADIRNGLMLVQLNDLVNVVGNKRQPAAQGVKEQHTERRCPIGGLQEFPGIVRGP